MAFKMGNNQILLLSILACCLYMIMGKKEYYKGKPRPPPRSGSLCESPNFRQNMTVTELLAEHRNFDNDVPICPKNRNSGVAYFR